MSSHDGKAVVCELNGVDWRLKLLLSKSLRALEVGNQQAQVASRDYDLILKLMS